MLLLINTTTGSAIEEEEEEEEKREKGKIRAGGPSERGADGPDSQDRRSASREPKDLIR